MSKKKEKEYDYQGIGCKHLKACIIHTTVKAKANAFDSTSTHSLPRLHVKAFLRCSHVIFVNKQYDIKIQSFLLGIKYF